MGGTTEGLMMQQRTPDKAKTKPWNYFRVPWRKLLHSRGIDENIQVKLISSKNEYGVTTGIVTP
jgi:hypothetical protein